MAASGPVWDKATPERDAASAGRVALSEENRFLGVRVLGFLALFWVVVNQFRDHLGLHVDQRSGLVHKGYLGAALFFVATGFLVADLYVRQTTHGRFRYRAFLFERLSRTYPLHLAMMGVLVGLLALALRIGVKVQHGIFEMPDLAANLLLVQAWGTTPTVSWNFPSWLISAEWFGFLVFPITAWLVFKAAPTIFTALAGALVLFFFMWGVAAERHVLFTDMTAQIGALQTVPAFLLGAGLYRLWRVRSLTPNAALAMGVGSLLWIGLGAAFRWPDYLIWPAFGPLVFAVADRAKRASPGGRASAVASYLGDLSYPMFLVYLPVDIVYFHAMGRIMPNASGALLWLEWTGVFPAILIGAALAHHLVQRPAYAWLNRLRPFGRKRRASTPGAEALTSTEA